MSMKRPSRSRPEKPFIPSSSSSSSEEEERQNHPNEESEEVSSSSGEEEEDDDATEQQKQPPLQSQKLQSLPSKSGSHAASDSASPGKPESTSANSAALKRHGDGEARGSNLKRAKKIGDGSVETDANQKKSAIQRVWGEDDEIAVLQGIIDYVREKGVYPSRDVNFFYSFMIKRIEIPINKSQLMDKISRLKKKYKNNSGKHKSFSKPHDQKTYELSSKIWGDDGVLTDVEHAKANGTVRKIQKECQDLSAAKEELLSSPMETEEASCEAAMPSINGMIALHKSFSGQKLDEGSIKEGLTLLDDEKKVIFERRWKQLQLEEWELHMKRISLIHEQAKYIGEALKSKLG